MTLDKNWIERIRKSHSDMNDDEVVICGVVVEMPIRTKQPTPKNWQRRVLADLIPDSPMGDAPEKILFRVLNNLTTTDKSKTKLNDVFVDSFHIMAPLFTARTSAKTEIPTAFHVLAVKAANQAIDSKSFTERTFLLLCRNESGTLNKELIIDFLEEFRRPVNQVDLAQSVVLERIRAQWDAATEYAVQLRDGDIQHAPPFVIEASINFQRDLETVLRAELSSSDFFDTVNKLFSLHLGLYLPRLACHLNPAMEALFQELEVPNSQDPNAIRLIEAGEDPRYAFHGSLAARAPSSESHRVLPRDASELKTYAAMRASLAKLHFNLLILNRLRELSRDYARARQKDVDSLNIQEQWRTPANIVQQLQTDPAYRKFINYSAEILSARFIKDQIDSENQDDADDLIKDSPTSLHALRSLYEMYNRGPKDTQANKQGYEVINALLSRGDDGIIRNRKSVGHYFELGTGMLPLLLMLTVRDAEKISLLEFWKRLEGYGLRFEPEERQRLLDRLKSMGLYERFSDAGEASYVRNLMTMNQTNAAV